MNRRLRYYLIAIALGGLAISVALFLAVAKLEQQQFIRQFELDLSRTASHIEQDIHTAVRILALFDVKQTRGLLGEQTQISAETLVEHFPDLEAMVWAYRVAANEREAWESGSNPLNRPKDIREVPNDGTLREASPRSEYFPIETLVAGSGYQHLIGLDIAVLSGFPPREQRMGPATWVVPLMPVLGYEDQTKLLVFNFRHTKSGNVQTENNKFNEVIGLFLGIEQLIKRALIRNGLEGTAIKLVSHPRGGVAAHMGALNDTSSSDNSSYSLQLEFPGGLQWNLVASPSRRYWAVEGSWYGIIVLMAGLLLTGITTAYMAITLKRAEEVKSLIQAQTEQLNEANQQLELLTVTDSLTGVANRRGFDQTLRMEWGRAIRENKAITLLLIDVDCFKAFNDNYGHLEGDRCLKQVAGALDQVPGRLGDMVARYGGEEFAVILPNTEDIYARVAERCLAAVDQLQIPHEFSNAKKNVTVSIGSATLAPKQHLNYNEIIAMADSAMYEAKAAGRNRVMKRVATAA